MERAVDVKFVNFSYFIWIIVILGNRETHIFASVFEYISFPEFIHRFIRHISSKVFNFSLFLCWPLGITSIVARNQANLGHFWNLAWVLSQWSSGRSPCSRTVLERFAHWRFAIDEGLALNLFFVTYSFLYITLFLVIISIIHSKTQFSKCIHVNEFKFYDTFTDFKK